MYRKIIVFLMMLLTSGCSLFYVGQYDLSPAEIHALHQAVNPVAPNSDSIEIEAWGANYILDLHVSAHLLQDVSYASADPTVRDQYTDKEALTLMTTERCAKIMRDIVLSGVASRARRIIVSIRHGVVTYRAESEIIFVATLWTQRLKTPKPSEYDIRRIWEVNKNKIPGLRIE